MIFKLIFAAVSLPATLIATSAFSGGVNDGDTFISQGSRDFYPPANLVKPQNGDVAVPTGSNYTNTRDGTVYVPAGRNSVIDTRTGRFITTP